MDHSRGSNRNCGKIQSSALKFLDKENSKSKSISKIYFHQFAASLTVIKTKAASSHNESLLGTLSVTR